MFCFVLFLYSFTGNQWNQSSIATFSFLCSALLIGGCGMPAVVMYCRKRQQMKSGSQQKEEQEESGVQNYMNNVYI